MKENQKEYMKSTKRVFLGLDGGIYIKTNRETSDNAAVNNKYTFPEGYGLIDDEGSLLISGSSSFEFIAVQIEIFSIH